MTSAKRANSQSLGAHQVISAQGSGQLPSQKTIFEHFACTRKSDSGRTTTPPHKRRRLAVDQQEQESLSRVADGIKTLADMYTFTANDRRDPTNVVDLTASPNSSPAMSPSRAILRSRISAPSSGPKRLVVKNLKKSAGPDPQQYYNDVWKRLDESISAILGNEAVPHSKETMYNEVMILCRQNKSEELCHALNARFSDHVKLRVLVDLEAQADSASNVALLQATVDAWSTWAQQLETIHKIFYYLDRSYILRAGLPSVSETGMRKFQTEVLDHDVLRENVLHGIRDLMLTQRKATEPVREVLLLERAVRMFHTLGEYGNILEPSVLAESQRFYTDWADQTAASTDLAAYAEMCDRIILREMEFAGQWALDLSTAKQLETYLEDVLIDGGKQRLLDSSAIGNLMTHDELSSLRRIYLLLERRHLGSQLKGAFEAYIVDEGCTIVFDESRELDMVSRLLDFKKRLDIICENAFMKNVDLGHTLREAFETFINKSKRSNMTWGTDNPKPGEMIAKHVDRILRGGVKAIRATGLSSSDGLRDQAQDQDASSDDEDVEIGRQLDQVLDLFRFVHGKAVFEAFYKRDLARRLLLGRSASSDAEKSMLTRLKSECGAGFTHNLEQMFKDIEMAREEMSSYKTMLAERQEQPPFDLSANVLSSSAWPSYPDVGVNVPEGILKSIANFERNYKLKHSGRKLEWKHALAHCQLKSTFPRGTKEVVVSSFQAIVLLSFNDAECLSYKDLQAVTGLDDIELRRTLQSLACAKYRVLTKTPKGKEVEDNDSFSVNLGFQHPKYRIKINQVQAKETRQENQQTHERVAADRAFETQAAIVRIMKSKKTIEHQELVVEVINATKSRGPLDVTDIKKNIEKLIEKDYLERDDDARNVYSYVA